MRQYLIAHGDMMILDIRYYKIISTFANILKYIKTVFIISFVAISAYNIIIKLSNIDESTSLIELTKTIINDCIYPYINIAIIGIISFMLEKIFIREALFIKNVLINKIYGELTLRSRLNINYLITTYKFKDIIDIELFLKEIEKRMKTKIVIDPQTNDIWIQ